MGSTIVTACVAACVASAMTVVLCLFLVLPQAHPVPMIAPASLGDRGAYQITTRSSQTDFSATVAVAALAIVAIVAVRQRNGDGGGVKKCIVFIAQRVGQHSSGPRNNATIAAIIGGHIDVVTAVWTRDEADPVEGPGGGIGWWGGGASW